MATFHFVRFDLLKNIHLFPAVTTNPSGGAASKNNSSGCGKIHFDDYQDHEILSDPLTRENAVNFLNSNREFSSLFCGACVATLFSNDD